MARVRLPMGIREVSGKVGNVCFRTMKSTGNVFVGRLPRTRTTLPSAAETAARERFALMAKMVNQMRKEGSKKSRKELWQIVKDAYVAAN